MLHDLEEQVRRAADARYGSGSGARLTGGLQNVRGDWLEYILGLIFWNTISASGFKDIAIIRLPNATTLPFHALFEPQARGYLDGLFHFLREQGMQLVMSNPDFLCVTGLPDSLTQKLLTPLRMGETSVAILESAYEDVRGRCKADSILFALTVKASVRPDRRYQIVHEANVVKALVAHLASRFWKRDLYVAFYAMVASRVSNSDREVFRNPATHTLVHVSWTPAPLVDQVFEIDSTAGVADTISNLLENHLGK